MDMKILLLTQYYMPETGAPQNRLQSLATNLRRLGAQVEVLTALPNYPKGEIFPEYRGRLIVNEDRDGIAVHRTWLWPSRSSRILPRMCCYLTFAVTSLLYGIFRLGSFDVIFCESPPLFLGPTAVVLKWMKQSRLVFNVADLWPESAVQLGVVSGGWMLRMAYWLEGFLYRRSDLVTGQTKGIVHDIELRYPGVVTHWLPNGIDVEMFKVDQAGAEQWRRQQGFRSDDFIVMYAGVIGIAQGLEVILQAADRCKSHPGIKFVMIGDGPERERLTTLATNLGLTNFYYFGVQSREQMPAIVGACDAYVVPLKNIPLFAGTIPSKVFEPMILAKPILLGVSGEAKDLFIDQAKGGIAVEPENADELAAAILQLVSNSHDARQFGINGRKFVLENFNRADIAARFWQQLAGFA
jgi:glycosyltransferase involved in cell wall biosynthesis